MADTNTYQAQANELSQKLWAIANELRGQMDASEFKNYILGVIFYRYLSERTEMYMAEILENDDVTYEEAFADDDDDTDADIDTDDFDEEYSKAFSKSDDSDAK